MFKVTIKKDLKPFMWYHDKAGKEFYVRDMDEDFYKIPRTNKVIHKVDCIKV